jgi:hypothetical protein
MILFSSKVLQNLRNELHNSHIWQLDKKDSPEVFFLKAVNRT